MNHPLFYTPEEAEQAIKRYGPGGPSAESIRAIAREDKKLLGFETTVVGSRVYIPRKAFDAYWGIEEDADAH